MVKYDGWIIKATLSSRTPRFLPETFHRKRTDVVKDSEDIWNDPFVEHRRKDSPKLTLEIVKVKFVEVK